MASFQNFVNCSHKPSLFFKVAQVFGITVKQLSLEFKGFRVNVMLPKTRSLHLYHKLDLIPKSLLRKKKKLKKVMKNSHAANQHKNTKHTHKNPKSNFMYF